MSTLPTPRSWQPLVYSPCAFAFPGTFPIMESHSMWLRSGFFHSGCAQGSPAWWQVRYVTSRVLLQHMHVACFVYSFLCKPMEVWRIPTCAMVNEAATDIHVQVFAWMCFSSSPRGLSAGAYSNSLFNHQRNYQTVFQRGFATLHSHQPHRRAPTSPRPGQHSLSDFSDYSHPGGWEARCLTVVLTCISLMTDDTGHLFVHLLTICSNLFRKCF